MKISKHKKVIKLWGTPRRKVSDSSPCCCTSDPLGTMAPWLIARDETTHSKCQEGASMGSKVQFTCGVQLPGRAFFPGSQTHVLLAGKSISGISRSRSYLRRSMTWQISTKWRAIFLHIFASLFFLQFFISLYL